MKIFPGTMYVLRPKTVFSNVVEMCTTEYLVLCHLKMTRYVQLYNMSCWSLAGGPLFFCFCFRHLSLHYWLFFLNARESVFSIMYNSTSSTEVSCVSPQNRYYLWDRGLNHVLVSNCDKGCSIKTQKIYGLKISTITQELWCRPQMICNHHNGGVK